MTTAVDGYIDQLKEIFSDKRKFIESFLWIRDKQQNLVRFKFNEVQEWYWPRRTPRDIILKFRKGGFSTLILGEFFTSAITEPGTTAAIISYEETATQLLLEMADLFYYYLQEKYPQIEWPEMVYDSRRMKAFKGMDSKLYIGTAESRVFGAGATITHLHGCLHPDSEVLLVDGLRKGISNVTTEDKTYSAKHGGMVDITNTATHRFRGKLCRLTFYDNPSTPLLLTPEHLVIGRSRDSHWVRADECKWIGMPVRSIETKITELPIYKYQAGQYRDFRQDGAIPLDYEFGWLVGLYYAEGSLRSGGLHYALSPSENDYLKRIKAFCSKYGWGVASKVYETDGTIDGRQIKGRTLSVQVNSASFGNVIRNIVGETDKVMPDWFWQCPIEFLDGVIDGYVAGDGSDDPGRGYESRVTSVRPQLLFQLRQLLLSVRQQYSSIGYSVAREDWNLSFPTHSDNNGGYKYAKFQTVRGHPYVFIKLRKREWVDYDGLVYDIETRGSFSTPVGMVHNSEMAKWPMQDIENFLSGFEEAVPKTDNTRLVYECTAQGEGNIFHQKYLAASSGNSVFTNHFVPWFTFAENSLPEGSQFALPADKGKIQPNAEEINMMMKYNLDVNQIRFWRSVKAERGQLVYQEYPLDDVSCFISSGGDVWPRETLQRILDRCRRPAIDDDGLKIWESTLPGMRYFIGCDVASGTGSDYDYAVVGAGDYSHVASLRGKWSPKSFAYKLSELGELYGMATIGVERNTGWGERVLDVLMNTIRYPNIFHEVDYQDIHKPLKAGWYTDKTSKAAMLTAITDFIETNKLRTDDEGLVKELLNYKRHVKPNMSVEFKASTGGTDDGVTALGIMLKMVELSTGFELERRPAEAYGYGG